MELEKFKQYKKDIRLKEKAKLSMELKDNRDMMIN